MWICIFCISFLPSFALVSWLTRRRSERIRGLILTGYDYVSAVVVLTILRCQSGTAPLEALVRGLYDAVAAITFQGDTTDADVRTVLAFFLMSICMLYTVVTLIFWGLVHGRLWFAKKIYVVWGARADAAPLLEDLRQVVQKVAAVWIPYDPEEELGDLPAIQKGPDYLLDLGPEVGREHHIVLLPDASGNAVRWLKRLDKSEGKQAEGPRLHVTAVLDDALLHLEDLHISHLDAYLVSRETLAVRDVLSRHRPLAMLRERDAGQILDGVYVPSRPFTLCVAGSDALSRAFLLATYEDTAFETAAPDRAGLRATVLETDSSERAHFFQDFPALASDSRLDLRQVEVLEDAFSQFLEERAADLDEVLISTGDTTRDTGMAVQAVRTFRRMGLSPERRPFLVVALHGPADGNVSLLEEEKRVAFLRDDRSLFTYETLIRRDLDREAENVARRYLRRAILGPTWNGLGTFEQDSNRAVVRDLSNKRLLAQGIGGLQGADRQAALERLARYEHRRWVAFYAAHGWQVLPAAELTAEERASFVTNRPDERRHICMVEWDELDALPQREPGLLKKYDYENVRELFEEDGGR